MKENLAPQLSGALTSVPDITVPSPIVYDYSLLSFFSDREGDDFTFTVTESPDAPWLAYDSTTHKLSGTPPDNTHAGTYTLTLTATNVFPSTTLTNSQQLEMKVLQNAPPVIIPLENKQALVPDEIIYDIGANYCTDPEGLAFAVTVTLADGSNLPSYLTWTAAANTF